jgi:hypothetical protein
MERNMTYPWESELAALADQPDVEAAAAINVMTTVIRRPVPRADIKRYIYVAGIWYRIKVASEADATPQQVKAVLVSAMAYLNDQDFQTYDVDAADGATMLAALVATGVVTQAEVAAVTAMANVTVPKYTPPAQPGEVHAVRAALEAQQ